ncbi:MAG TPA: hypothetical protein VG867_09685 [Rhizomicrobium sp.]|nr:hypothetical protein [Rhizomicrobium sp.]
METLLKAIQSRKLDRIAAAYAVAGWILVQAASIAQPAFDLPSWSLRAFIIFVGTGFPAALAIAWFMSSPDVTDEGLHWPVDRRRLILILIVALVFVLSAGEIAYWLARAEPAAPVAATMAPLPTPQNASIAVLPFDNMSGDPSKVYFSDGISDEILNDLANVPALRVAARASSFSFRGKNTDIKDIARLLAVRTVLQGSVRASGEHIRITAQLVNASDGYVIWSSVFDRDMTDVLTVQDEIARAITTALTNRLLPEDAHAKANRPVAINAEAYRAYLEGQYDMAPRTPDGEQKALVLFQKAAALQPDFAEAFAALGRAYINVGENNPNDATYYPAAQAALKRALELAPDNLSALAAHLDLSFHLLDFKAAIDDANRMQKINPGSAVVLHEMFRFYQFFGFPEVALQSARAAAEINPLSVVDRLNIAAALLHAARYADAASAAEDALTLHNEQTWGQSMLCTAYAHTGRSAKSRLILAGLLKRGDKSDIQSCRFDIALGEGHVAEARAVVDEMTKGYTSGDWAACDIGDNYAIAGDFTKALAWLARAYDKREFALFTIPTDRAIPAAFFDEAGWKNLKNKPLMRDWQSAHDAIALQSTGG